ncbi:ATP-binding protein [Aquiflexum gelatinilyticum]|uniref:ATP-binding protein n=1 Tax=Aquiflexum gelatinilyticum TaxID=2961943 RepID=UPI002166DC63|nr:ATP-binding protein [Aquiflexum gelatinilyticum]MCS4435807.1 ATP-binding protein [Aquiflexum gelatinilyticum]
MLKRLVILHSEIYSKADIELGDCDSLQIVGPNNIGKSTLIYALNFLYIIDGKQMTFSGNRTGDKSTINHYFPSINSSYIIFEIFKKRYYCILVKKNAEGSLDYYKIDSDYKEEHYFEQTPEGQKLKKFDSLLAEFSSSGVVYSKYSNRRDLFNFVYQKGKKNNGVVWLNEGASQDQREISNNFSKIYRYLINSKLIDNKTLKESLIIADNKENEQVEFSKKNQKDIQTLLKHNKEIKAIRSIKKSFSDFKELVNQYKAKNQILSEIVYAFEVLYSSVNIDINTRLFEKKNERDKNRTRLSEDLTPKQNNLNQTIGKLEATISQKGSAKESLAEKIRNIKSYEGIDFLKQSFSNLDTQRKDIESRLTQIENQNLNSRDLENKISKLNQEISKLDGQIETYSNLLIHQISKNGKDKELLNAILSDSITALPKENIQLGIENLSEIMKIFDGAITIPKDFKGKPIPSIDDLKLQRENAIKEKISNEKLLPIAKDLEKYRSELSSVRAKIKETEKKIEELNSLPELEKNLAELEEELKNLFQNQENTGKELKQTTELIARISEAINILSEDINKAENRIKEIQGWKVKVEQSGIIPIEYQTNETLDNLFKNFERNSSERESIKNNKERLFENLKTKTETGFASEDEFIKYLDSELATLEDKQKSIDALLKNISTQFSIPCKTLHSKFQEFEAFINNQFNSKIRKIKISDIDSLSIEIIPNENLIKDLKKIMDIRDLTSELIFDDQSENLNILNRYLDNQFVIDFNNLFDIKLHLDKKGQHKVVDLRNQIESDGTDKMIRMVIIMSIIHQIVINDEENKIVIFVDEIGTIDEANRIEILNFCKENNFVPISAAPLHPYDGFDKYYLVRRSKGKIVLSETNGNVIYRKKKTV